MASSSSRIVNYDLPGANMQSAVAMNALLTELVDTNRYKVVNFSQAPKALEDLRSSPVSLFVVSGGKAPDISEVLWHSLSSIKCFVEDGGSFWGNGAGAILATSEMLFYSNELAPHKPNPMQEVRLYPPLRGRTMKLSTCNSCLFNVPGYDIPGTQVVRSVGEPSFHQLYTHWGVFFPNARTQPNTEVLLESASYRFSGEYLKESHEDIIPVVAAAQKVGKGTVLLCGGQPEMRNEAVQCMTFESTDAQKQLEERQSQAQALTNTTTRFLNKLSIVTKKV